MLISGKTSHCSLSNSIIFVVMIASAFVSTSGVWAQGKLGRVRQAVRRHDPPSPVPTPSDHHDDHDDHADHGHEDDHHDHAHDYRPRPRPRHRRRGGAGSYFSLAFRDDNCHHSNVVHQHVHVVQPPVAVVNEPVVIQETYFDREVSPSDLDQLNQPVIGGYYGDYFSSWSGRLSATYGLDFAGMGQGSFGLLLQSPGSLGLDMNVTMIRESGMAFRDHLWMGDVNLVYEVINSGNFRARAGVGVNWLGDQVGGEAGANLTMGFDWQLTPDWILTGESDFGSIGDSDLFRGELSLGRQFGNAEWTTGYRHTDIGGATFGSVFTGFRFRF